MKKTIFLVVFAAAATVSAETTSVIEYDSNGWYVVKKSTVENRKIAEQTTAIPDKKSITQEVKTNAPATKKILNKKQPKPYRKQPETKSKSLEDLQKERAIAEQKLIEYVDNRNRAIVERERAEALRIRPPAAINPP